MAGAGFSRIAIAGDSAGGGLALVIAARMIKAARDQAAPRPVAVCMMSPWTDLALTGNSIKTRAGHDPVLSRRSLKDASQIYLGEASARDPLVSPLYGDMEGLPPVLLHAGEDEILLDDARRYADRLWIPAIVQASEEFTVSLMQPLQDAERCVFPKAEGASARAGTQLLLASILTRRNLQLGISLE